MNYKYASQAARASGDLQKAVINGERALQSAEKTEDPFYMLTAIQQLIWSYQAVKIFEKSDLYIQRGFDLITQLPQNSEVRDGWQGVFNDELGRAYMRRQDYANAIDAYQAAIYWYRSSISRLRPENPNLKSGRNNIVIEINRLGAAYRLSKQLDLAMAQYSQAFESIEEWSLAYPYEDSLHTEVGEVYIQQRRFPEALESFHKALSIAEAQHRPAQIRLANLRIAYILRQAGKAKEATAYERRATDQEKSIRSLLLSPDDGQP
jgi:tetratricopeptide (TPR) repeat protein